MTFFFDGYRIDTSPSGTLSIRSESLDDSLLQRFPPQEKRLPPNCERYLYPDPFPDVLTLQVSSLLYQVNSALLQRRIVPSGTVANRMEEHDFEAEQSLEAACLFGMLHHPIIKRLETRL